MSKTETTTPEGDAMLDDLDAAMASSEAKDKSAAPAPSAPQPEEAPAIGSATLAQLPKARRPNPSTVCEACPASVWFATPKEVKCFCRVMHLITWSTAEPGEMTHCDGLALASED